MKTDAFYIGINQRIPLGVLESSFYDLFETGSINKDRIIQQLQTEFRGKNRVRKGLSILRRTLSHPRVSRAVKTRKLREQRKFSSFSKSDKNALYLSMMAGAYPIVFSLCNLLGSVFRVQNQCSIGFIRSKLSARYGSNRATQNAIYSLIPMMIEMGILKRDKPGLYSAGLSGVMIQDKWISQIYMETYLKGLNVRTVLIEDTESHPWFYFYKPDLNHILSDDNAVFKVRERYISISDLRC